MSKSPCGSLTPLKKYTPAPRTASAKLGRCAENLVVWYLKQRKWRILARNFATKYGEIDIIATKYAEDIPCYPTVAFIEVKSRSSTKAIAPQMNVTAAKQKRIISSIKYYTALTPRQKSVYRCDIAAITLLPKKAPAILYIPNAFCVKDEFGW